jgi:NitT/TauT family transport system permease protein
MPQERLIFGLIGFVAVLVLWEGATQLELVRRALISSPSAIFATAVSDFSSGYIWPHIGISLKEYGFGFAVALVLGIPLGLAIGFFRHLYYFLDPWISAMYATPTIALVPLIILVFGIGLQSKIVVVTLEAIFMILVTVIKGVHSIDERHLDIARSYRASSWLRFRTVVLPSSVPFILTGVRLGAGRALVGVVVAEFIASNQGIGFYITFAGVTLNSSRVMLGVILLGIFGIFMGELVRSIEERFDRWRPATH